jgi:hypothetical protein
VRVVGRSLRERRGLPGEAPDEGLPPSDGRFLVVQNSGCACSHSSGVKAVLLPLVSRLSSRAFGCRHEERPPALYPV